MVHVGERRLDDGRVVPLYLLDDELARLLEGFCPFSYRDIEKYEPCDVDVGLFWHTRDDGRLTITEDGWARCSDGNEYRYPPRVEW